MNRALFVFLMVLAPRLAFGQTSGEVSGTSKGTSTEAQSAPGETHWNPKAYAIRIGAYRPTFNQLKGYRQYYGREKLAPYGAVDWLPGRFRWLNVGLGLRGGFYGADGHACEGQEQDCDPTGDAFKVSEEAKTRLNLTSVQGVAIASLNLFDKFLQINGWAGADKSYYQEVRLVEGEANSGSGQTSSKAITNSGSQSSRVVGYSCSFLLNWMEPSAAARLDSSLGFSHVYLTVFGESVAPSSKPAGANFGRKTTGIAFSFEGH